MTVIRVYKPHEKTPRKATTASLYTASAGKRPERKINRPEDEINICLNCNAPKCSGERACMIRHKKESER